MSNERPRAPTLSPEAHRLREKLGQLPTPMAEPWLIILTGLPGTGKSTLARRLANLSPVVVVATDWVRKQLFTPPTYTAAEDVEVHRITQELIVDLLRGGLSVVRDAVTAREPLRQDWAQLATDSRSRPLVVELRASPTTVYRRLEQRHGPGRQVEDYSDARWEHYLQIAEQFEPVVLPHFVVDTDRDGADGLDQVLEVLRQGSGTTMPAARRRAPPRRTAKGGRA